MIIEQSEFRKLIKLDSGYAEGLLPARIKITNDPTIAFARSDAADCYLTDMEGHLLPSRIGVTNYLVPKGKATWTWFTGPQAIRFNGLKDRTYFVWYDMVDSQWMISAWDHDRLLLESVVLGVLSPADKNDHNNPSLCITTDGRIVVACGGHHVSTLKVFRSDAAESLSAFTEINLSALLTSTAGRATYPQLELLSDNVMFLSWRGGDVSTKRHRYFVTTDDLFDTTTSPVQMFDGEQRVYLHQVSDGDHKVHFAVVDNHPGVAATGTNKLLHYCYDHSIAGFRDSFGNLISGTPNATTATLIEDAAVRGRNLWEAGIALKDGNPRVVYSDHDAVDGDTDTANYRYASWDGSSWTHSPIVYSGEGLFGPVGANNLTPTHYILGLSISHDDPNVVYACVSVDNGGHELRRYVTYDDGATWRYSIIGANGSETLARPIPVRNHRKEIECLYLAGQYTEFVGTDPHEMGVIAWPGPAAVEGNLTAFTEIDFDETSKEIVLHFGGKRVNSFDPFSSIDLVASGDLHNRTLGDNSVFSGQSNITVVAAFRADAVNAQSTIVSDWTGTNEGALLFRFTSAGVIRALWKSESSVITVNANVTLVAGQENVAIARLDAAESGRSHVFVNNVKSSQNFVVGTLPTHTVGNRICAGVSPHSLNGNTAEVLDGEIDFVAIYRQAKSDNWCRAATNLLRSSSVTFGPTVISSLDVDLSTILSEIADAITDSTQALAGGISSVGSSVAATETAILAKLPESGRAATPADVSPTIDFNPNIIIEGGFTQPDRDKLNSIPAKNQYNPFGT